jgi:hypothetical protein
MRTPKNPAGFAWMSLLASLAATFNPSPPFTANAGGCCGFAGFNEREIISARPARRGLDF